VREDILPQTTRTPRTLCSKS